MWPWFILDIILPPLQKALAIYHENLEKEIHVGTRTHYCTLQEAEAETFVSFSASIYNKHLSYDILFLNKETHYAV